METNSNSLVKVDRAAQIPALQLSKKEFLTQFNPDQCTERFKADIIPLDCAKRQDLPLLADISRQYGREVLITYIYVWITNTLDYFGKKYPDNNVIKTCISDCLKGREYLNIADVNMIFSDLRRTASDVNMPRFVKAFADYAAERAASYYENQLRKDDVLKKHGYMPKEMSESEIQKKLNESVIEYQMQDAERKARLELVELNQNYHLHEVLKMAKKKQTY
ncbi:MAG: hypothetical protein II852_17720 [Bacteroidales bacterium]|nr:hypothetical protein [Bacteroidales bacterium]